MIPRPITAAIDVAGSRVTEGIRFTETRRAILIALCRPIAEDRSSTPATNPQIASEVSLTVDSVKISRRTKSAGAGLDDRGFVDFVAMICRRTGREMWPESSIGSPAFPPLCSSSCEGPAVPVGIYGYASDILDGVGIHCAAVGNTASDGPLVWGSGGANRGDFDCPRGTSLNGLTGVYARYFGGGVVAGLRRQ